MQKKSLHKQHTISPNVFGDGGYGRAKMTQDTNLYLNLEMRLEFVHQFDEYCQRNLEDLWNGADTILA